MELLVVMVVFIVVIAIISSTFKTILTQASKLFRSEESNIEGVIGLEMLRHDLQQMGYGLFTENFASGYTAEAAAVPASTYNEPSLTAPPRAVVIGNNLAAGVVDNTSVTGNTFSLLAGTDYLAIKATSVGRWPAAKRWTYLKPDATIGAVPATWPSASENFAANEKVVVLRRNLSASTNSLAVEQASLAFSNSAFSNYSTNSQKIVIYGLADDTTTTLRMPFNRSDYFVARPGAAGNMPNVCAPKTGILYKTIVNNSTAALTSPPAPVSTPVGGLEYIPVLDCVADMQVVLMWDLRAGAAAGQDGSVDTYSDPAGMGISGTASQAEIMAALADSSLLRQSLKGINVYVLAQNGRMDPGYTSPSPIHVGDQTVATNTRGRNINLDEVPVDRWRNYRWKLYQIIVRPKNLTANQ